MGDIINKKYIFGLPRSGTNFLSALVRNKFNLQFDNPEINGHHLWKHSVVALDNINKDDKVVFIYKNIYTWIESILIRYPSLAVFIQNNLKNQNLNLSEQLIQNESNFLFCDYLVSLETMVNVYQNYINQFILESTKNKNILIIEYENLLTEINQKEEIKRISNLFDMNELNNKFFTTNKVAVSNTFTNNDLNYYINKKPIFLPENMVNKIKEIIEN